MYRLCLAAEVRLRSMQCLDSVFGVSHDTFLIICTFDKIRAPKVLILCLLLETLPRPSGHSNTTDQEGEGRRGSRLPKGKHQEMIMASPFWNCSREMPMSRWSKGKGKKNWRPSGRRSSFFKPFLESLEDRHLLSVGATLQGTVVDDS